MVPAQRTAVAIAARGVFDCLPHDSLSPCSVIRLMGAFACCYFPDGATPASFVVQNAVVGVVKEQTQLEVGQGWVALHPPPQAKPFAPLRNCRAETVPAQRTLMISAVKNIDLIFFMIAFLPVPGPNVPGPTRRPLFCRLGGDEIARACREAGLHDARAAEHVGAR